jgi:putative spermidine/putrescine transport system permease protein
VTRTRNSFWPLRLLLRGWVGFVYAFLLVPFLVIVVYSLDARTFARFPPENLSFKWYFDIPPAYTRAFVTSLLLGIVVSVLACLIGMTIGLGLARGRFRGKAVASELFRAPLQVPTLVVGVIFLQFYYMLAAYTGIQLIETFTGLVIAHLVIAFPYTVGTIVALIERFPKHLEEAAWSLGASRFSTLIHVIVPYLKPGIYAGMMLAFISSFGNVSVSIFLSGSGLSTLPVVIFSAMAYDYDPRLLAVSTIVVFFCAALIYGVQKLTGLDILLKTRAPDGR